MIHTATGMTTLGWVQAHFHIVNTAMKSTEIRAVKTQMAIPVIVGGSIKVRSEVKS